MSQQANRRSRTKRWLLRWPRTLPVAIFLLIAAITVLSIFAIERVASERATTQLQNRTAAIASAMERRANASSAYLRAGAALLATSEDIPAERFRRFVSELRLDADYRGAGGIGWAMVVRPGEIEEFNQLLVFSGVEMQELYPRPSAKQDFSVPITFLEPNTESNRRVLGYDMYSESVRRAAMDEAAQTAQPTASGLVVQPEISGEEPGFLIYMPVFETVPRGRRLRGFIYSPFNAQDFLASALELEDAGQYGVRLYDGEPGEEQLLASNYQLDDRDREREREIVTVANVPFVLQVSRVDGGFLSGLSVATLVFGLLVASLLMLLVRMLTQQAIEDEASLDWFAEQASIRNSLTRELNHRVKNTLANVLSIIALTRRRADDVTDFADGLDGRIRALSATHDLLTKSDWGTTPIDAVMQAELLPYSQGADHTVEMSGPEIELAPNDALSLGLAVHELATNAAKYGALSRPGGKVKVSWELTDDDHVRVEWVESGGPPVAQVRGRGFGTDLIERVVAHELSSPVKLQFEIAGVRCVLMIPVRERTEFAMRANRAEADRLREQIVRRAELDQESRTKH